ncbi:Putative ribonuclease H protein At1g65750 [Linum perenne]
MGFKNLRGFNLALLAKQCWNLQTNPDALVSRIYKAKYYPRTSFLEAVKGENPSLVWQSLWNAQKVVRQGIRWRIGDGSTIRVWDDPWINDDASRFVTTEPMVEMTDLKVNELWIPGTKQWDVELIEELFNDRDAKAITEIPLNGNHTPDAPIWHFGKDGALTVRSAYRVWENHLSNVNTHHVEGPWIDLWKLHTPARAKIMAWRLARDIVPTRETLRRRHIEVAGGCGLCDHDSEWVKHLFLECPFAQECWDKTGLKQLIQEASGNVQDFNSWLARLLERGSTGQAEKVMVMLWSLWREQNARVWRGEEKPAFVVARMAIESLLEWQQARRPDTTNIPPTEQSCKLWHPPAKAITSAMLMPPGSKNNVYEESAW